MKRRLPWLLLFMAGALHAAERPADYAYGWLLEADGKDALYEVVLPAAVYQGVARADLGDVRVFNGKGEVVPHALRPRPAAEKAPPPLVPLTLFPLKAGAGSSVDALTIRVRRSAGGATSVDIVSQDKGKPAPKRIVGYFVDVSALDEPLRAIEFDWPPVPDGFAGRLRVDASDDLANWRTVAGAAPLVGLEMGGQQLRQNRVELALRKAKYLRLSWVGAEGGREPPALSAARGELAGKVIEPAREWATGDGARGEQAGEYRFDLGGRFPVDRARFELPQPNTIAQVELLSRARADQPWRPVARGIAYRLRQEGAEIASPELSFAPNADRYWLLRVDMRGGGLGDGLPRMQAGWVPQRLVFAARGAPPFYLAYGNREAQPAAYAIQTLIPGYRDDATPAIRSTGTRVPAEQLVNVQAVRGGAQKELGGQARREEATDWKRWSLWGALVLGVAVLGAMAWRLARQLNAPDSKS